LRSSVEQHPRLDSAPIRFGWGQITAGQLLLSTGSRAVMLPIDTVEMDQTQASPPRLARRSLSCEAVVSLVATLV